MVNMDHRQQIIQIIKLTHLLLHCQQEWLLYYLVECCLLLIRNVGRVVVWKHRNPLCVVCIAVRCVCRVCVGGKTKKYIINQKAVLVSEK